MSRGEHEGNARVSKAANSHEPRLGKPAKEVRIDVKQQQFVSRQTERVVVN